jgi:hypothetical protein
VTGVELHGSDDFKRDLRYSIGRLDSTLQRASEKIGAKVVREGRSEIHALTSPGGSIAMRGLDSRADGPKAVLTLDNSRAATLFASVFGTLSHSVFGRKVSGSGPWLSWLGTAWEPEELYGLGPVLTDTMDGSAGDEYLDATVEALKPAFPD